MQSDETFVSLFAGSWLAGPYALSALHIMGKRLAKCQCSNSHPTPSLAHHLSSKSKIPQKRKTYPSSSRKHRISTLINIQMIYAPSHTPLLGTHIRLAEIPGVRARAAIDNLHNDTLAHASRIRAFHAARVGHLVAGTAVAGGAVGGGVVVVGDLAAALGHVDGAVAGAAGDVGGEVTSRGAVGTWGAWSAGG